MKVNLGTGDAVLCGLVVATCQAGMEPSVSDEAGTWLIANGHAEKVEGEVKGVAKAAAIQGVPPKSASHSKAKAKDAKVSE